MSTPLEPSDPRVRPPAAARWLLGRLLPEDVRDALLGDAEERFQEDVRRRGRTMASLHYWSELVRSRWMTMHWETSRKAGPMDARPDGKHAPLPARLMDQLAGDVKHGLRGLARAPGFALAAILTLGLGTGAATAVFSLVDGILLRPLPFREPERLVNIFAFNTERGLPKEPVSPVSFLDYRGADRVFEDAAAWWRPENNLSDDVDAPIRVSSVEVSENLFDVLGVTPVLGRAFPRDSTLYGSDPEVVISNRLWHDRFAADPGVLGRSVRLNGAPFTIVGVLPAGFNYPEDTDVWQRLVWNLAQHSRSARFMGAVARLRPGVSVEQADAELQGVSLRLEQEFRDSNLGWRTMVTPVVAEITGAFRPALFALLVAAGALLLIACMNVANLLLARSTSRVSEVALRTALGASRRRVIGQLLVESGLIAGLGAALGFLTAALAMRAFVAWAPIEIPRADMVRLTGSVLLFAVSCAAATVLVFGLAPALMLSRAPMSGADLGRTRGASSNSTQQRIRGGLVAVQLGLAITLLAGAGLLVRSVAVMLRVDAGVRPAQVVTANLELPAGQYQQWTDVQRFYAELQDALAQRPGVSAAGASNFLPLEAGWRVPFVIPDQPTDAANAPIAQYHTIDEGWLGALGVPLIAGRGFAADDDANAPGVIVVNEALVRRHFPGENVIGRRVIMMAGGIGPLGRRLTDPGTANPEVEIVGVVGDVRNASATSRGIVALNGTALLTDVEPVIYFPQRQFPFRNMNVFVRGPLPSAALLELVRETVAGIDPTLPIAEAATVERVLEAPADPNRLVMSVLGVFAAVALTLAAIGIYGVLSYAVDARRREIGIRMALGAAPGQVMAMVMRQGLWLGLAGGIIGLVGAVLVGRLLGSLLFQVSATDPLTLASVTGLVTGAALIACWIPGRRAASLEPSRTLGND
jgi:predicted permease